MNGHTPFPPDRLKIVEVQKGGPLLPTLFGVGEGVWKSFLKVCTASRILPHCLIPNLVMIGETYGNEWTQPFPPPFSGRGVRFLNVFMTSPLLQ